MEVREADGSNSLNDFVTSEEGNASFPVLKSINEKKVFVAYTETVNDKDYVKYKVVQL